MDCIVHGVAKSRTGLSNFHFASMWNEHNCAVVWTFFGIAFLRNWNEKWPFPVLWPLLSFPNLLAYWVQHLNSSSFRIRNSLAGIPSPPLALLVVTLPKALLSSYSRMSGSRWVTTQYPLANLHGYLGHWDPFLCSSSVYSSHFLISSASVRSVLLLSFIVPIFAWNVPLVSLIFLKRSSRILVMILKSFNKVTFQDQCYLLWVFIAFWNVFFS